MLPAAKDSFGIDFIAPESLPVAIRADRPKRAYEVSYAVRDELDFFNCAKRVTDVQGNFRFCVWKRGEVSTAQSATSVSADIDFSNN